MASHVSTCMDVKLCINRCVHGRRRIKQEGKEKGREGEKGKEEKKERKERKEKKKKKKKRKEVSGFFLSSLASQRSEFVELRSKVWRFDEGLLFKR